MEIEILNDGSKAIEAITRAETDIQIETAKKYPRSIKQFLDKAKSLATINEDVAGSCSFAIPRGGKVISGKSVRLAEIVCSTFGNIRAASRVVANDGQTITAQGVCHDLENNNFRSTEVKMSILQNEYIGGKKTGKKVPMSEDMQVMIGNAACAKAYRNAVFSVVPAALVDEIENAAKEVSRGTEKTLPEKRKKAVDYLKKEGITDKQICEVLNIKRIEDIDLDLMETLRGMVTLATTGEDTLKNLFSPKDKKSKEKDEKQDKAAKDLFEKIKEDD